MKVGCNAFWMYKEDVEYKAKFFYEIENLDKWNCFTKSEAKTIYTKKEPDSNILSFCFRIKINVNLMNPFVLLAQVENFKSISPDVLVAEQYCKMSDYREIVHVIKEIPWPLANRELYVTRSISYLKEKNGILINMRSLNEERAKWLDVVVPQEESSSVKRAEMIKGFMFFEEIDEDSCW